MIANTDDLIKSTCEKIVNKYKEENVKDAFSLISKLLNNILANPKDAKFRNFKKTNEMIKSKILILKETQQLMYDMGYKDLDSEYMVFEGEDISKIKTAVRIIEDYLSKLNKIIEQQEVKKREEEARKLQEEVNRMAKEEFLRKQKIQEGLELDKKERMQREKANDSVGKKMDFGAKVCKFEPKRGGGG
jgi:hypothetical protein